MNVERIQHLIDWLKDGSKECKVRFNMNEGIVFDPVEIDRSEPNKCGAAVCLAGATVWFFNDLPKLMHYARQMNREESWLEQHRNFDPTSLFIPWYRIMEEAPALLGLEYSKAQRLFVPGSYSEKLYLFNDPEWAIRVLQNLIVTGKVDWWGQATEDQRGMLIDHGFDASSF